MPKQTVHRVLQQLEEAGTVQRSVRRDSFVLGGRMRDLALSTLQAAAATLPIRAELERLASEVGESVNLGILNGYSVRSLERVERSEERPVGKECVRTGRSRWVE